MEDKLYYKEAELLENLKYSVYFENSYSILFDQNLEKKWDHLDTSKFVRYRKLYLLMKGDTDVHLIYVSFKVFNEVIAYLNNSTSRWIDEFGGYIFYSIEDLLKCCNDANKNKLF